MAHRAPKKGHVKKYGMHLWSARFLAVLLMFPTLLMPVVPVFGAEEAAIPVSEESQSTPDSDSEPEVVMEEGDEDVKENTALVEESVAAIDVAEPQTEVVIKETPVPEVIEETVGESNNGDVTTNTSQTPDPLELEAVDDLSMSESMSSTSTVPTTAPDATTTVEILETASTTTPVSATSTPRVSSSTPLVQGPDPGSVDVSTTTLSSDVPEVPDTETVPDLDEVEENPPEAVEDTEEATTTEPVAEVVNVVYNDENRYTFAKDQCVSVGDGTFYCAEEKETEAWTGSDRVYAARDSEGDLEIYLESEGVVTQITDNATDDDAPYYDDVSETIAWHRLIDGRYQIISYELEAEEEIQVTRERYNNMQPSRFGDVMVWQGWIGDDWEIMMEKGETFAMLTDNTTHDIDPHINGNYILWQSFEDNVWRAKVYDTATGKTDTIADSEGGSVQNPRFVLVYDTKHENGDVETMGYDLENKTVVPLAAAPAPIPTKIPDPDETGEKKALVQPNIQVKTKTDAEGESDAEGGLTGQENSSSTPAMEDSDVVIPPYATSTDSAASSTPDVEFEIEAENPATEVSSSTPVHIEDLIITPFVEPVATSTDSQGEVASSE